MLDIRPGYQRETEPGLVNIKPRRNAVVVNIHAKTGTFGLHFCIARESFQMMIELDWEPWQAGDKISRATRACAPPGSFVPAELTSRQGRSVVFVRG